RYATAHDAPRGTRHRARCTARDTPPRTMHPRAGCATARRAPPRPTVLPHVQRELAAAARELGAHVLAELLLGGAVAHDAHAAVGAGGAAVRVDAQLGAGAAHARVELVGEGEAEAHAVHHHARRVPAPHVRRHRVVAVREVAAAVAAAPVRVRVAVDGDLPGGHLVPGALVGDLVDGGVDGAAGGLRGRLLVHRRGRVGRGRLGRGARGGRRRGAAATAGAGTQHLLARLQPIDAHQRAPGLLAHLAVHLQALVGLV